MTTKMMMMMTLGPITVKDRQQTSSVSTVLLLLTKRLAWRLVQKLQGHVAHTKKDDMFRRLRKKQEGQRRHQYEVTNKYTWTQ